MTHLTAAQLGELCAELAPLLVGATVKAVVGLPPRDLLLLLEGAPGAEPERILRLRVSADPEGPRLFLQTARQKRPGGPVGPFFRRVEADVVGARLAALDHVRADRLVRLGFDNTPSGEPRSLFGELTGRHGNLVWTGPGDRVLEVLVPAPSKPGRPPRLVVGEPWQPPPGSPPTDPGPALADALELPPAAPGGDAHPSAPLSFLVEHALGQEVAGAHEDRLRRDLVGRLGRKLKRARSLEAGLRRKAEAADGAERIRMDGELLKAALGSIPRGRASIELDDWFEDGSPPRTIELDPKRSPHENVERLFARYKKLLRSAAGVHADLDACLERQRAFEDLLARLAEDGTDPEAIEAEALERKLLEPRQVADPRKKKAPEPRKPYRSYTGCAGGEIRVGRNARDNDELTLRHCRGGDLWLHTADAPGSHVVLRLERGAEPDPEEVLDAAHLAVHFSPLRGTGRADVHVARRKEVHKPKGAKPGLVHLSGGRTLRVRMQPERLRGLLEGSRPSAGAGDHP